MKHKFENDYTDKKGVKWNKRCKVCYNRWKTKPKTDECKGKPNFEGEKKGTTPKKPSKPKVDNTPVAQFYGESYRIQTMFPAHEANYKLEKYLKNRRSK